MGNFQKELFQEMLNEIIGDNTRAAFAEKIGISRIYLQNLLSDKAKAPSKNIAVRIAKQANDRIQRAQFLIACGYDSVLTPRQERELMDEKDWTVANAEDVKAFFSEYHFLHPFDKAEFLQVFHSLYGASRAFISFGELKDYTGEAKIAETVMPVRFIWHNTRLKIQEILTGVLFGHLSSNHVFYVTDMSLAVRDLVDAYPEWHSFYQGIDDMYPETDTSIMDAPYCFTTKTYDPLANLHKEPQTTEERLLKAIFGDEQKNDAIISVYGYGFYLDDEPEYLVDFLRHHRASFENSDQEKEFCHGVLDEGREPAEMYRYYSETIQGPATVVAEIIKRETDLPFDGWDHENEDDRNRNCVLLEDVSNHYHADCIKAVAEQYARELHLSRIETCIYYLPVNLDRYHMQSKDLEYDD